jgi:hypothetical protein
VRFSSELRGAIAVTHLLWIAEMKRSIARLDGLSLFLPGPVRPLPTRLGRLRLRHEGRHGGVQYSIHSPALADPKELLICIVC